MQMRCDAVHKVNSAAVSHIQIAPVFQIASAREAPLLLACMILRSASGLSPAHQGVFVPTQALTPLLAAQLGIGFCDARGEKYSTGLDFDLLEVKQGGTSRLRSSPSNPGSWIDIPNQTNQRTELLLSEEASFSSFTFLPHTWSEGFRGLTVSDERSDRMRAQLRCGFEAQASSLDR